MLKPSRKTTKSRKHAHKPEKQTSAKRQSKRPPERDVNQMAFDVIRQVEALGSLPEGKDPLAVLFGRRGGLKGGRVRAERMTEEERSASARRAAQARWKRQEN